MNNLSLENFVDNNQYPISQPQSEKYAALLHKMRTLLKKDWCAVLSGFITAASVKNNGGRSG